MESDEEMNPRIPKSIKYTKLIRYIFLIKTLGQPSREDHCGQHNSNIVTIVVC